MQRTESNKNTSVGSTNKLMLLGVILGICLVFYVLTHFVAFFHRPQSTPQNTDIVFSNNVLRIGSDVYMLQGYPDRVKVHGDYLLVIQPNKIRTTIYSISKQKKVREENKIIIDYDGTYTLSYGNDLTTYFNTTGLLSSCIDGYIISREKVVCIVAKDNHSLDNKL